MSGKLTGFLTIGPLKLTAIPLLGVLYIQLNQEIKLFLNMDNIIKSKVKGQNSKVQVKNQKSFIFILLSCSFAFCILTFALAFSPVFAQADEATDKGIDYLRSQQQPNGQIAGFNGVSAWATMAFSGAGVDIATITTGGSSLLDYLKSNPPASGAPATDWEREILAITSAGQNPFDFNGKNYVLTLESMVNNSQIGDLSLLNDDMFGLLALISAGDGSNLQIKQNSLIFLIANQSTEGGFGWSKTSGPDIDTTAAAIQALQAGKDAGLTNSELNQAIDNAKAYMLTGQNADGGFGYLPGEISNASTTAWAVMALSALEETGEPIQKAKDFLTKSQADNGSFEWQSGFPGDTFTSSFAILALSGEYWPVKVFEESEPIPSVSPFPSTSPSPSPIQSASPSPSALPPPAGGPSPSPSVTPSTAPSPSASPNPSVSPSATPVASSIPKPKPEIEFGFDMGEIFKKQQERITEMRKKQQARALKMQKKMQESMKKLSDKLNNLFK